MAHDEKVPCNTEHWFGDYGNHHLSYLCLVGFRALIIGFEVLTQKELLINGMLVNNQLKVTDYSVFWNTSACTWQKCNDAFFAV